MTCTVFCDSSLLTVCRHFPTDWSVLSAVLSYQLHTQDLDHFTSQLDVVFPLLVHNLNSPYHRVKLLTLKILELFEQPLMELNEGKEVRIYRIYMVSFALKLARFHDSVKYVYANV